MATSPQWPLFLDSSTNGPYIDSCLNLSTMTTSLQWQQPLKCVPHCQYNLLTTATFCWSTNGPYIDSCLNLSTATTPLQWQWPLKCVPNCQDNLLEIAIFVHQLMKKSRIVMKFDPMAFQNIIQVFLCIFLSLYNIIIIIHDWITIMGYSKHKNVVLPKKIVRLPPYLPILGHLSTMATLILLSLRTLAIVERFDCSIY